MSLWLFYIYTHNIFIYTYIYFTYTYLHIACTCDHVCAVTYMCRLKGNFSESLLLFYLPCEFWEFNLVCQASRQSPLPIEQNHQFPPFFFWWKCLQCSKGRSCSRFEVPFSSARLFCWNHLQLPESKILCKKITVEDRPTMNIKVVVKSQLFSKHHFRKK